MNEPKQ